MTKESEEFLESLYSIVSSKPLDGSMRLCMKQTDTWLSDGKFDLVDEVFQQVDVSKLDLDAVIGLLVFTRFAIDKIPNRAKFITAVSAISSSFDKEDYDYIKDLC